MNIIESLYYKKIFTPLAGGAYNQLDHLNQIVDLEEVNGLDFGERLTDKEADAYSWLNFVILMHEKIGQHVFDYNKFIEQYVSEKGNSFALQSLLRRMGLRKNTRR
ncbi:MAG TPA: hypothetical protein VLH19_05190 [Patescibacteria group bacterium]|nr:hypothetical protein [Patescibacteria group bacterium]